MHFLPKKTHFIYEIFSTKDIIIIFNLKKMKKSDKLNVLTLNACNISPGGNTNRVGNLFIITAIISYSLFYYLTQ